MTSSEINQAIGWFLIETHTAFALNDVTYPRTSFLEEKYISSLQYRVKMYKKHVFPYYIPRNQLSILW